MGQDLPLHDHYENFYNIAEKNDVFACYCEKVFGKDFSQDGFSDINQIHDIIELADIKQGQSVLDIGCGNGKMIEYIADKTGAVAFGFDYSKNAIDNAKLRTKDKPSMHFEVGAIGEIQYTHDTFDVIISVDTMYFAPDLCKFVGQIRDWLKPGGVFITYFCEGPFEKLSADADSTILALALKENKLPYKVVDYTKNLYKLMKRKQEVALSLKNQFMKSNSEYLYINIINQSIDKDTEYDAFKNTMSRNLYIARK